MKGHKLFASCCILLLVLFELSRAGKLTYQFPPLKKWTKNKVTTVPVHFFLPVVTVDSQEKPPDHVELKFTATVSETNVSVQMPPDLISVSEPNANKEGVTAVYQGTFNMDVTIPYEDTVFTDDVMVEITCSGNDIVCKANERVNPETVLLVNNTQNLTVKATPTTTPTDTFGLVDVTVVFTKDLATRTLLKLSATLNGKTKTVSLGSEASSSTPVEFPNVPWDDYTLTTDCGETGPCSTLKESIIFPTVTVYAHSWSQLMGLLAQSTKAADSLKSTIDELKGTVSDLKEELAALEKNVSRNNEPVTDPTDAPSTTTAANDSATDASGTDTTEIQPTTSNNTASLNKTTTLIKVTPETTTPPTKPTTSTKAPAGPETTEDPKTTADPDTPTAQISSYLSMDYMKWSVLALVVVLACILLGYLGYHYRVTLKEWVCSKKAAVSKRLPRRSNGGANGGANKYTRLPRTMQEALHQD